jgi:thiol:disulfide interchange protein DsbC
MKSDRLLAGAILALALQPALAGQSADEARLLATLKRTYPSTTFTSVSASEVPGIFEVWMGPNVAFVSSKNPRYFIMGRLLDAKTATDITGPKLARAQAARTVTETADGADRPIDISRLPLQDALKVVHGTGARSIYAFSDPACSFCRRLEPELAKLQDVTVYTFLLPFQGRQLPQAVLCSADPVKSWQAVMLNADTSGMTGQADCATPLDRNLQLARQLGVSGTPTIFYADGTRTTGYVPGAEIERRIASALAVGTPVANSKAITQEKAQ